MPLNCEADAFSFRSAAPKNEVFKRPSVHPGHLASHPWNAIAPPTLLRRWNVVRGNEGLAGSSPALQGLRGLSARLHALLFRELHHHGRHHAHLQALHVPAVQQLQRIPHRSAQY